MSQLFLKTRTAGVFDTAIANNFAYSLTGGNGVAVVDLQQNEQIQFLELASFGDRAGYTGMAVWP